MRLRQGAWQALDRVHGRASLYVAQETSPEEIVGSRPLGWHSFPVRASGRDGKQ
jgi:hypothetical protein